MNNFVYNNPTKIIFGTNCLEKLGAEVTIYGKKVFLLFGQNSARRNGVYSTITNSLRSAGCEIVEFSGITPNPSINMVREAIEVVRQNNCKIICAVGGGSVLDTGKAVSCGVPVNHDVWKFFTTKKSIKSALPLICVSTLAGSGSENNSGMVLTNEHQQVKFGYGSRYLYPKVSLLDPETTYSVPGFQTACGCVDIISHLLEIYCNSAVCTAPLQHRIIEGLMDAVMENCETALSYPTDYTARAQLMWASSLALSGLTSSGLGRIGFPVHLIEHSLAALYDTPHGAGLAVIMPAWMKHEALRQPERIAQLGVNLFAVKCKDTKTAALQTTEYLKDWFKKIGCPVSLMDLQINKGDHKLIAENTKQLAKIWRLQDYPPERVLHILDLCG